jgi:hypothetical protein
LSSLSGKNITAKIPFCPAIPISSQVPLHNINNSSDISWIPHVRIYRYESLVLEFGSDTSSTVDVGAIRQESPLQRQGKNTRNEVEIQVRESLYFND